MKKQVTQANASSVAYNYPVQIAHRGGPLATRLSVDLDSSGRNLIARDETGAQAWQTTLPTTALRVSGNMYSYGQGDLTGHSFVAWLGNRVIAIDGAAGGRVLWSHETITQTPANAALIQAQLRMPDAAAALGISKSTADRYWAFARAYLGDTLQRQSSV